MLHHILYTSLAISILGLSACGGGSSGSTPGSTSISAATNVSLTVSGKSLDFTWTSGTNVDHYRILVNPDGASGFTVDPAAVNIANTATSYSIEIPVHKFNWLAAQYIVEACNVDESTCESSPNQTLALIDSVAATVYVKSSNTDANDTFGLKAVLSGDGTTLAVGAAGEDSMATGVGGNEADNSATNSGAVYVYALTDNTWVQQAYLKASNTQASDIFGDAIALSFDGNTLAIGASQEGSAATGIGGNEADNTALNSGAVYVFSRTGTSWVQQAYVKASNGGLNDRFGFSVTLSNDGNTMAVGAYGEDSASSGVGGNEADNTKGESGAVYVFTRTGTLWVQESYMKASNTRGTDYFGWAVALSGDANTLVVSADREDSAVSGIGGNQFDTSAQDSGAVFVFARNGATWVQQAYIKASNTQAADIFGRSVSVSDDGNTLAVGAPYEDSNATGIDGDEFDDTDINSGAVYIFSRTGTIWAQQAYVKASNTNPVDQFGWSLGLSSDGNTLVVGARSEDSDAAGIDGNEIDNTKGESGAVFVFTRAASVWSQKSYIKSSNTDAFDLFGESVSISADGNTLAVGAFSEDSVATGVDGDQADNSAMDSGAVYLY